MHDRRARWIGGGSCLLAIHARSRRLAARLDSSAIRRGELLADSILDKQMRTKVLAVAIMAAFFGAPVQAASTEQGAPAYASTLRPAVIFENDTDSKLPLAERMQRWKARGQRVAVIDGDKIVKQQ